MATGGYAGGGIGTSGPSSVFFNLPFANYREPSTWLEEFIDAFGSELNILEAEFITSTARANLLDPTYTPTHAASATTATATAAPTSSLITATMLDVLCYIAGIPTPVDTNLSVAQKQALVQVGWDALKRKGTRTQLLAIAACLTGGSIYGLTLPPYQFSLILPDGAPSPGWGSWVPGASLNAVERPWLFALARTIATNINSAFVELGIGYSQFRAGFSGVGEPVLPASARINALQNEHFSSWTMGTPDNWTATGTATLTQSTTVAQRNLEFSTSAAQLDLSVAVAATSRYLSQSQAINNQAPHRVEVDYAYTNAQSVSHLTLELFETQRYIPQSGSAVTYYYDVATETWSRTQTYNVIPVGTGAAVRTRYAFDLAPMEASTSLLDGGTTTVTIRIGVVSNGTSATQVVYTLYRVGIYEKFDTDVEEAAHGERTLWLPLIDGQGLSTLTRTSTGTMVEMANAQRSAIKLVSGASQPVFDYHSAVTGKGFRSTTVWTNLVVDSNGFTGGASWVLGSATQVASVYASPAVESTALTQPSLTATGVGPTLTSPTLVANPSNNSYVAGIWVKKITEDPSDGPPPVPGFTDITLSLRSGAATIKTITYTVTKAEGWRLLPIAATCTGGHVNPLTLRISWGAAFATGLITVSTSYCYDVTARGANVLYPPMVQTPSGATAVIDATVFKATTATPGTDVLHPWTQRRTVSVARGLLLMTIVPTFNGDTQPDCTIFDVGESATVNRLRLFVESSVLKAKLYDDSSAVQITCTLSLTTSTSPTSTQVTWLRDTAIPIVMRWDYDPTAPGAAAGSLGLSAGTSNDYDVYTDGWVVDDSAVANVYIGCNLAGASQFDGIIRDLEVIQVGAAS